MTLDEYFEDPGYGSITDMLIQFKKEFDDLKTLVKELEKRSDMMTEIQKKILEVEKGLNKLDNMAKGDYSRTELWEAYEELLEQQTYDLVEIANEYHAYRRDL